jgi:hypothetical protein
VSIGKGSQGIGDSTCSAESLPKHDVRVTADFVHAPDNSVLVEFLVAGPNVAAAYSRLVTGISVCRLDLLGAWKKVSFPSVGSDSSAYASSYSHDGLVIDDELVIFREGPYFGAVGLGGQSAVNNTQLQSLVLKAIAKLSSTSVPQASSGTRAVVTCTTEPHHWASCIAPGWEEAEIFEFDHRVPKDLGACLTKQLPRGYRALVPNPQTVAGAEGAAFQDSLTILDNAFGHCSGNK